MNHTRRFLRPSRRASLFVFMLVGLCLSRAEAVAAESLILSTDSAEDALDLSFAPQDVFGEPRNLSVVLAAFENTTSEIECRPATGVNQQPLGSLGWNSSTQRLAGLTSPSTLTELLPRLAGVTVFVLVTCVVSLWLARRWLTHQGLTLPAESSARLAVTESLSIAPHSRLHIVRVDDCEFLATVNAQGLQQLVVIPSDFGDMLQAFDRKVTA